MKTKLILSIIGLLFITGCSKSADELFELSNDNLKNNEIDQAIIDLETLVSKYPQDSLAAHAQYKLASIQLNWKNNLANGHAALQTTANNFGESIQGIQAQKEIEFLGGVDFLFEPFENQQSGRTISNSYDPDGVQIQMARQTGPGTYKNWE